MQGWFSVDFTLKDLSFVKLKQRIYSRSPNFDGTPMQILTVDNVYRLRPPGMWLNIPHNAFFSQHNLSTRSFVISASKAMIVNYISSPEIAFLQSIVSRFRVGPTKLVFRFLELDDTEPSTNQTYGSLLRNLTYIRTFAAGILVPKTYIWPVDSSFYLSNHTSLVMDAHTSGLEVFASNFINDAPLPYDYSHDPVNEHLSFIDNRQFSVDGMLSDFPLTSSAAIDCFSHMGKNQTVQANILVMSSEGASGDYPGCTDLAYAKAVSDGVDILDCPVQMTSDGIPFCLGSINLRDKTNVAETAFSKRATTDAALNVKDGVFAYNLTWSEIQTLKPAISNPYLKYSLYRNPKARDKGILLQLSDFLSLANNASSVSGVLISIENAAYLAEKQGLGVTDAVIDALDKAGYDNQTAKRILIKSSESAVLRKLKSSSDYELVYVVDEDVRDISNATILEIKTFAGSVVVSKKCVFPSNAAFLVGQTAVVPKLKAFNLSVYVQLFQNEFVSQPWDFFSDAYVEISTHTYMGIDGIVTDFPATAAKFKRNRCLGYANVPPYMSPVQPGGLIPLMAKGFLPPAEAPNPVLMENDVSEAPLPAVRERPRSFSVGNGSAVAPASANPSQNGDQRLMGASSRLVFFLGIIISMAILLCV
ncbi:glycerophosphodiester phosphodiesterase GDPDL4-like isoform X2 [Andrographis paniculata]|nr:glycerophosphodiester phosphodiesterase GDPDL4-like isoform X2 [Andrographis paniculata]